LSLDTSQSWTGSISTPDFYTKISLGSYQYWSGSTVNIGALAVPIPTYFDVNTGGYYYSLAKIQYDLYFGKTDVSTTYYEPGTYGTSSYKPFVEYGTTFSISSPPPSGIYSISLNISEDLCPSSPAESYGMGGYTYTYSGSNTVESVITSGNQPSTSSVPFMTGWTYSGVSATASWTFSTNDVEFYFTYSAQQSSSSTLAIGDYSIGIGDESATFTGSGTINVLSYTISWSVEDVVAVYNSISNAVSSGALTQTPTEGGLGYENQWNSTISYTIQPDSSLINGATVDGKTWSTTVNWNVNHIESVGSSITSQDTIVVSGHKLTTISNPDGAQQ
jgi:hypothetical protein